jgi:hypothetical protein
MGSDARLAPASVSRVDLGGPMQQVRGTLAGETGFDSGAEGATAPETLRQKDRERLMNAGKQAR